MTNGKIKTQNQQLIFTGESLDTLANLVSESQTDALAILKSRDFQNNTSEQVRMLMIDQTRIINWIHEELHALGLIQINIDIEPITGKPH